MKINSKKLYSINIMLITLSFICSGCDSNSQSSINNVVEEKVAKVNGEYIYKYEIDRVYAQYESNKSITYDKIVNDTIDEILVIQASEDWDVNVTDDEVDKLIAEYKESYGELYNKAISVYGEKDFYQGQRDRLIYYKTKQKVLEKFVNSEKGFTNQQVKEFIQYYDIENELKDYNTNEIKSYFSNELNKYIFDQWVENLKNNAEIIYY